MKNTILLFLLIGLHLSCGEDDTPPLRPRGSMIVTTLNNLQVVADVRITTVPITDTVFTDLNGTALISDVGIGRYKVEASHPDVGSRSGSVSVVENDVVDLTLHLSPGMFERPVARLQSPRDECTHNHGDPITFAAYAADVKDLPNTLDIAWASSIDGIFNSDAVDLNGNTLFLLSTLSKGEHVISLKVIDSDNFQSTDQIAITIQ